MRVLRRMLTLALAVAFGMIAYPIAAQGQKQIKQAKKLLEKIKLVDGTGSGLDADTVQGITPTQVKASITPPTPRETLIAVKAVDGVGSGLDADTLRGLAPAQVAALAPPGGGNGGLCCPRRQRCFRGSGDRPWRVRSHDCAAAWC